MKKILITASVQSQMSQFLIPHIKLLKEMGYEVHAAARDDLYEKPGRELTEPDKIFNLPFTRSPVSKGNFVSYRQLKKIINEGKYSIIHCHTPACSVITRLAARVARKKGTKVFYTAHGFHFYKSAPFINWLIYYTAEKLVAPLTDLLITINNEDYETSKRLKVKERVYLPGVGVNIEKFDDIDVDRMQKRRELGIPDDVIFVVSVGELTKRKNHEVVIRALSELEKYNIFYMICGNGPLEAYLKKIAEQYKMSHKIKLGGYRKDLSEIYKAADLMIFPSLQEGLPVAVMEAMAAGLPVICSEIRGNTDLIHNRRGGIYIYPSDYKSIKNAVETLLENPGMAARFADYNRERIKEFGVDKVLVKLKNLYEL